MARALRVSISPEEIIEAVIPTTIVSKIND